MKKIELIKFELHALIAWPLKIICFLLAIYIFYGVYIDIMDEYIVRSGIEYTLDKNPVSFYTNTTKNSLFGLACLYLSVKGISVN